ncbi:MAG: hypothetical protein RL571_114 [Pseudomonadota bacterium]|jgi:colicin import membrane protein
MRQTVNRNEHRKLAFALAAAMHLLLVLGLLLSMNWQTKKQEPVVVELWGGSPAASQQTTPAVETPPTKAPKQEPKQEPKPEPKPEPLPEKPAEIATAKVKPTLAPRPTPSPVPTAKPTPVPTLPPKASVKPTPAPVAKPTTAPNPKAKNNKSEMNSILSVDSLLEPSKPGAKPGGKGNNPNSTVNTGPGSGSGNSPIAKKGLADYRSKVSQLIRSKLVYPNPKGNPSAEFRISLLPNGEIQEVTLLKPSGETMYDEAAKRAILALQRMPPLPDGQAFSGDLRNMTIMFRLND